MKRNRELFEKIADQIEKHPESYDQHRWFSETECGTVACIAGWASYLDSGEGFQSMADSAERLGLATCEAYVLFDSAWSQPANLSIPEALRRMGQGERISAMCGESCARYLRRELVDLKAMEDRVRR